MRTKARSSSKKRSSTKRIAALRITDQESARVVAIYDSSKTIVGAGCLLSSKHVLSCCHVVQSALDRPAKLGSIVHVQVIGLMERKLIKARIVQLGNEERHIEDLAVLELIEDLQLANAPVEFAAPLRHSGKSFSVLGFPDGVEQGRNVSGTLQAVDAAGLVQMDGTSPLLVQGGFSGAPVWSSDVGAFVGIVVTELSGEGVAWCIPSRAICAFFNALPVRFRIPPADRPQINDYEEDDPNLPIFGSVSDNGERKLTAQIEEVDKEGKKRYCVTATYECLEGSQPPRGEYVTFITHPSFTRAKEDAYELFGRLDRTGKAMTEFYPTESFTIAAVGDGGDTALTLDLASVKGKPRGFR